MTGRTIGGQAAAGIKRDVSGAFILHFTQLAVTLHAENRRFIMDNKQATLELGTKPVGKLLMQYALPAIVAMTASSLYNMIDSIFIGQGVGALAISGLAITFPLMNLSAAFGAAVGIGSSTCISVKLGQKDYAVAENIFGNSFTLNLIVGLKSATIIQYTIKGRFMSR